MLVYQHQANSQESLTVNNRVLSKRPWYLSGIESKTAIGFVTRLVNTTTGEHFSH